MKTEGCEFETSPQKRGCRLQFVHLALLMKLHFHFSLLCLETAQCLPIVSLTRTLQWNIEPPSTFCLTEAVTKGCTWRPGGSSVGQIRFIVSIILNMILWTPLRKEKPMTTHLQIWGDAGQE